LVKGDEEAEMVDEGFSWKCGWQLFRFTEEK